MTLLSTIAPPLSSAPRTQVSALIVEIRHRIVSGELAPGTKLRIKALADRHGTSVGSVREALSRLTSSGLIVAHDQRGFYVAEVSEAELRELTSLRKKLEIAALRESIAAGDLDWETGVLTAHHRLARLPSHNSSGTFGVAEEWDHAHRVFHMALLSACSSRWLMRFVDVLSEQINRYRHLSVWNEISDRDIPSEHRALLDAALSRDTNRACALLISHITETEKRALVAFATRAAALQQ